MEDFSFILSRQADEIKMKCEKLLSRTILCFFITKIMSWKIAKDKRIKSENPVKHWNDDLSVGGNKTRLRFDFLPHRLHYVACEHQLSWRNKSSKLFYLRLVEKFNKQRERLRNISRDWLSLRGEEKVAEFSKRKKFQQRRQTETQLRFIVLEGITRWNRFRLSPSWKEFHRCELGLMTEVLKLFHSYPV